MKKITAGLLAAAIAATALAAIAVAHSVAPTLQLRSTKVGKILVSSRGFTIYVFTRDRRNTDNCARQRGCLSVWPPVARGAGRLAGPGVRRSLIGSIRLRGGLRQLTYAGHPLYTYTGDSAPAQTHYVNVMQFGGRWPALSASGREVR